MTEWRLFPEGTIPECSTSEWYARRDRAPHLEEAPHVGRLRLAAEMVNAGEPVTVVDLGAGDGGLLSLLNCPHPWRYGYDLQPSNVEGARGRGEDVWLVDVVTEPIMWAAAAVATEMLEHIVDPHGFLAGIPPVVRSIVASSPYLETGDSHYEYHLWAWNMAGYAAMFEGAGWTVVDHRTTGLFQVLRAVRT
jgi:hypothetical protein